jgi:hypothetical protein
MHVRFHILIDSFRPLQLPFDPNNWISKVAAVMVGFAGAAALGALWPQMRVMHIKRARLGAAIGATAAIASLLLSATLCGSTGACFWTL